MSDPFIAEIKIFAGNFAPRRWALCNGQLFPIAQNTALFALVGTTYGGDGRTTLGLPDLQGRAPMHPGRGPGLSARRLGEQGGSESVTLNAQQLAAHSHAMQAVDEDATQTDPSGKAFGKTDDDAYSDSGTPVNMSAHTTANSGGGGSHNNLQPFLTMNFIIALTGVFPSRG